MTRLIEMAGNYLRLDRRYLDPFMLSACVLPGLLAFTAPTIWATVLSIALAVLMAFHTASWGAYLDEARTRGENEIPVFCATRRLLREEGVIVEDTSLYERLPAPRASAYRIAGASTIASLLASLTLPWWAMALYGLHVVAVFIPAAYSVEYNLLGRPMSHIRLPQLVVDDCVRHGRPVFDLRMRIL